MLRCGRCHCDLPSESFGKDKHWCRSCKAAHFAAWYANNNTPERRAKKVANTAAWRKANPNKRRSLEFKRRAAKVTAGRIENVDRATVYERDGWRCWICGEMTEPDAEKINQRPSLDHVVALMDGGSHTYDNLRCAHRGCNTRRGSLRYWERERMRKAGVDMYDVDLTKVPLAPAKIQPERKDPNRQMPGATICRNGHAFTPENTILVTGNRRRCRICDRAKQQRRRDQRVLTPEQKEVRTARVTAYLQTEQGRANRRAWLVANKNRINQGRRDKWDAGNGDRVNALRREKRQAAKVAQRKVG